MPFLLDTNACIRVLNGTSKRLIEKLRRHEPSEIKLCSVVRAELIFGAENSERVSENKKVLYEFFSPFESLPFDDDCAAVYGRIRAGLERVGRPIGPNDLMIAAIATHNSCTLVTHNVREFSRVEGLSVDDWE